MPINSGALWGLISVIAIAIIIYFITKRRNERGCKKVAEEKIYRPDEWEQKRKRDSAGKRISNASAKSSGTGRIGSNVRQKSFSTKSNSASKRNSSGNKKSNKADKQHSVAIPDIEQIEE